MPVERNSTTPDNKTRFNLTTEKYLSQTKSINLQEKAPRIKQLLSHGTEFMRAKLKLQPPKNSPTVEQVRDAINQFAHSEVITRYTDSEGRLWEKSFGLEGKERTQPVFYENGILRARNYTVLERLKKAFGYDNQVKVDPRALEKSHDELRARRMPKVKSADATISPTDSQNIQKRNYWTLKNPFKGGAHFFKAKTNSGQEVINSLGDRPLEVQRATDKAFENNKAAAPGEWNSGGRYDYYSLLGLDEGQLFKNLASEYQGMKDIYIIDVGCAEGQWGRHAFDVLQGKEYKEDGKNYHILSVTGGQECKNSIEKKDNVTLYQFNHFKVENIDEEFKKRGFDLKNKVALIVSNWALRHLVDPFGTLKRMYSLLTPARGKLMSNGFFFMFNDSNEVETFPLDNEKMLVNSNAVSLFNHYTVSRDVGQFLLMRTNNQELQIPLEYTNKVHFIGDRYQNMSQAVTAFKKSVTPSSFEPVFVENPEKFKSRHLREEGGTLYCNNNDQRCKDLYFDLKKKNLFVPK